MYVAQLRFIQSLHESPERRNPDTFVRYFIPLIQRLRGVWVSRKKLSRLRADPFYYYLVARTVYYDHLVNETVSTGVRRIVSIGAGSDTRAYRFVQLLHGRGVRVVECDQAKAIFEKRRIAKRLGSFGHVEYLPIDLNAGSWPEFAGLLGNRSGPKTLVLMEGVSPYIDYSSFRNFSFSFQGIYRAIATSRMILRFVGSRTISDIRKVRKDHLDCRRRETKWRHFTSNADLCYRIWS